MHSILFVDDEPGAVKKDVHFLIIANFICC